MASVDEILATMSAADATTTNIDEVLLIDPNTRQISIPGAELILGVEFDTHSERKYFQCPRYVGNDLDLADCSIRVNYRNANNEIDAYLVDDVVVSKDTVTFSWELSQKVTQYMGEVKFLICCTHHNGDDVPPTKWHTTQATGNVLVGLEPDGTAVETASEDVITALLVKVEEQSANVEAVGANQVTAVRTASQAARTAAVAEIEAKGASVRESIPDDYTALGNAVDGLVQSRAGAIVCEAAGSVVTVDDASDMALHGMRIFGRSTQEGVPSPDAPVEIVSVAQPTVTMVGKNLLDPQDFKVQGNYKTQKIQDTEQPVTLTLFEKDPSVDVSGCYIGLFRDLTNPSAAYLWALNDGAILVNPVKKPFNYVGIYPSTDEAIEKIFKRFDVQVEVGSTSTQFEPYKPVQKIETLHTLHGIPVTSGGNYTDENGQQWISDEVDLERGVYIKRVHTENLTQVASLNNIADWTEDKSQFTGKLSVNGVVGGTCLITHGVSGIWFKNHPFYAGVGYPSLYVVGGDRVKFGDTVDSCNKYLASLNAVSPVKMTYVLETPVETPLSETEIAAYRAMHSNYPNTTVLNDCGSHMVVKYAADTKRYIDKKIKEALQ